MLQGILIVVAFLVVAALMMTKKDPYSAGASFDGCRHLHHRRCADVRQKRGRRRDRLADHRV